MGRDAVGPRRLANDGPGHGIGLSMSQAPIARLAHRGNMINIQTQLKHTG